MKHRSSRGIGLRAGLLAAAFLFPAVAFAAMQDRVNDETVRALRGPLAATARLRIDRFPIDGIPRTLELERFEVWASNAEIIDEGNGVRTRLAVPTTRFFRGRIVGQADSLVFLSIDEVMSGLIISGDRRYNVHSTVRSTRGGTQPGTDVFVNEEFDDLDHPEGFHCAIDGQMITPPKGARHVPQTEAIRNLIPVAQNGGLSGTATHTLNLALEADNRLFNNMGGSTNVTTFIGNLVGAASTIYQRDLRTDLVMVFTRIQSTSTEPFTYPNGTTITDVDVLAELGDIWHNAPPSGVPHSAVVRLSGNAITSGIAWIQTACSADFLCPAPNGCGDPKFDNHYAGEYAYCGGLGSTLTVPDPNLAVPASNFWPLLEFSHELGHVVSGEHTHCIPLNATDHTTWPASASRFWVDQCYGSEGGCYPGAVSVPAEKGSIMSYCHNVGGGTQTRYLFGVATDPSAKVINGAMGGAPVPNGGILPYLTLVTPDSPSINAPASVSTGAPTSASINGPLGNLTYDWTITNGTIVGSATGTSITFTGTANPATLRVRATINTAPATSGCAASDYKTITVTTGCVAPVITTQPASSTVSAGTSVTLSVNATGTLPLGYQWYQGSSGDTSNPIAGATGSSVTVQPGTSSLYWVRVTAGCGASTDSNTATITVTITTEAPATASRLNLVSPCRLIDTRNAQGPQGGPPLARGVVRTVFVGGQCGISATAKAVVVNITVVGPTATGWLIGYPGTGAGPPATATLNYRTGKTRGNNAIIRLSSDGKLSIYNSGPDAINFVVDTYGYFE